MSYMVSQRTREFGIRMAFGASRSTIALEILRSAGILAVAGGATGLALAAMAARTLTALISGVRAPDLTTYASAAGLLAGVALIACLQPGWRAISVDPTEALRE